MKIRMKLLSDVIFGNGVSIPGGEDISVLCDKYGFPYYKGSTFKGIFREELCRYLDWIGFSQKDSYNKVKELLGESGDDTEEKGKLVFSDFCLSENVKYCILKELGENSSTEITNILTHTRTFTKIDEEGIVQQGSLRVGRCVNKGLYFYSNIECKKEDEQLIEEVCSLIKWIGTMRNRVFGKVQITVMEE